MIAKFLFASFLAVIAVVVVRSIPDATRYLKIREM
jgi:hypothetical protein